MSAWDEVNSRLRSSYNRNYELLSEQARSSKTTFVWFVGISGYIIVNAKEHWMDFLGIAFFEAHPLNILLPYIPSFISVLLGITSYLRIENWFFRFSDFNKHFSNTFEYLTLDEKNGLLLSDLLRLDTDSTGELKKLEKKVESYNNEEEKKLFTDLIEKKRISHNSLLLMNRIARLAMWTFFVSFIWAVAGPLLILFWPDLELMH